VERHLSTVTAIFNLSDAFSSSNAPTTAASGQTFYGVKDVDAGRRIRFYSQFTVHTMEVPNCSVARNDKGTFVMSVAPSTGL
jgi:hypothetical protein